MIAPRSGLAAPDSPNAATACAAAMASVRRHGRGRGHGNSRRGGGRRGGGRGDICWAAAGGQLGRGGHRGRGRAAAHSSVAAVSPVWWHGSCRACGGGALLGGRGEVIAACSYIDITAAICIAFASSCACAAAHGFQHWTFQVRDNFPPLCSWPCSHHFSGDLQVSICRFLCPQALSQLLWDTFIERTSCTLGKLEFNALQYMCRHGVEILSRPVLVCVFVHAFRNESTHFIPSI